MSPLYNQSINNYYDFGVPDMDGASEGDFYVDMSTSTVYKFVGGVWIVFGSVGEDGQSGTQVVTAVQSTNLQTYQEIAQLPGIDPDPDGLYAFEYVMNVQSTAVNSGVHLAWAHPTGLNDFVYAQWMPSNTYASEISQWGGPIVSPGVHAAPAANVSFGGSGQANAVVGSAPGVGNIRPRFKSETPGATARIMPGSWLYWEKIG